MMQIIRFPHGNVSYIVQIRNISALKDLGRQVGVGDAAMCERVPSIVVAGSLLPFLVAAATALSPGMCKTKRCRC